MNEFKTENKPFVLIARIHVKPGNGSVSPDIGDLIKVKIRDSYANSLGGLADSNLCADTLTREHVF